MMRILQFALVFAVTLSLVFSFTPQVFAGVGTCETVASGDWDNNATWDSGVPGGCNVVINNGHTVTITSIVSHPASITIAIGGALIVDGPNGGNLTIEDTGEGTNNGQMTMNGGDSFATGSLRNQGSFTNTCSGDMVFNGGSSTNTGSFRNEGTGSNSGIMTFNGGDGTRSGSLNNDSGSFTNHNTINFIAGGGSDAGELIGQITDDPEICPVVGGEFLPIDSTALILAGAQTNAVWIMSALAVIGSVAFGALYITSKKN